MDTRNMVMAIVLAAAIMFGWQYFIAGPEQERIARQQQAIAESAENLPQPSGETVPGLAQPGTGDAAAAQVMDLAQALAATPRVAITSPKVRGSLSLVGARIDDLILTQYRETIDSDSPEIRLLSPLGVERPYYADFGWVAAGGGEVELPKRDTLWQSDGKTLTPDTPVRLSWTNGQGLTFEQAISIDENYMFQITQSVANNGATAVTLAPYGLISRTEHPDILGFYILHEGLIGAFSTEPIANEEFAGGVQEIDYDDVVDADGGEIGYKSYGGWIGITDKYWQTTLVPDQQQVIDARFVHTLVNKANKYQSDILYSGATLQPGAKQETTSHLFAGAKVVELIDGYEKTLDIPLFDRSVDFGWFYYLTKPFFYVLHWLAGILGNFGLAILACTVLVKIVFFPLANKSYRAMAKMRKVQPEMLVLRERFGDDKQRLNQEMMALYKREGANPMAGCLPVIIQIPVFFALYKVLFVTIEMRHAPFYGWIRDLSAPDPTSIINGFGLLPWAVPNLGILDIINIGIWPILMGMSMVFQHRLNPQPADPLQAKIFTLMPIMFTFLLAKFPAGLVIYWTWNNLLSILQQVVIMKRAGVPIGRQPPPPTAVARPPEPPTEEQKSSENSNGGGGKKRRKKKKKKQGANAAANGSSKSSGDD